MGRDNPHTQLDARSVVGHFVAPVRAERWLRTVNAVPMFVWPPMWLTLTVVDYAMALPLADDAIDSNDGVHIIRSAMVRLDSDRC